MGTIKDFLGNKDIKWWDGLVRTFSRRTSTGGTLTQNKFGDYVDVLEVYGDGTDYSSTAINNAISAIGTNKAVFKLKPGTWTISESITVPSNVTLDCPHGVTLEKSGTSTITINGPFKAESYQVFSGFSAGDVTGLKYVNVKWFGAQGDDSTNDTLLIEAAVASVTAGVVEFPQATYRLNWTVTNKDGVEFIGNGSNLKPYADGNPALKIHAAAASHVQRCYFHDFYLNNQAGFNDTVGILFSGVDATTFNDFNTYRRLWIYNFKHGMQITHRAVWNTFDKIDISGSKDIGFKIETATALNLNTFRDVRVASSQKHGMYIKQTGGDASISNNFYNCNFESNGLDTSFAEIAGLWLENIQETIIDGCYIENNGVGASDGKDCSIRIAGTYAMNVSVTNSILWGSTYSYENKAGLAQGRLHGNRFAGIVHVEVGTNAANMIEIGVNYGGTFNIVADGSGFKYASFTTPLALASAAGSGTTLYIQNRNYIRYNDATARVVSSIADGTTGQLLILEHQGGNTLTLQHGTSANELQLQKAANFILPVGVTIVFIKTDTAWVEINGVSVSVNSNNLRPDTISVGASPFYYTNATNYHIHVVVTGGTVSEIGITRPGSGYVSFGTIQGQFYLAPLDQLAVVYAVAPNMYIYY